MRQTLILGAIGLGTLAIPAAAEPSMLRLSRRLERAGIERAPVTRQQPSGLMLQLTERLAADNAPQSSPGSPRAALLAQAKAWESRDRLDLALEALNKLFTIDPHDPDGLAQAALLQLQTGRKDLGKQTLAHLRRVRPNHPDIRRIEVLVRLQEQDKPKLREAQMLARGGHTEQALALYDKLFPGGPPTGDLALEYWRLVADTDDGWERAYAGMRALVKHYPDNQRYQLAFARLVTVRRPDDPAALKTIIELSRLPLFDRDARDAWRHAMLRLSPSTAHVALIRQYLASEQVEDKGIEEYLANMQAAIERQRKLMADPYYRARLDGLALLDGGKLDAAEERLTQALKGRPDDPEVLGGLGLLRMRQGHHAEAQAYLEQALRRDPQSSRWKSLLQTDRFWGLMREASDAADDREYDLALYKLRRARDLDPRETAAIIAQARVYTAQDRLPQAEAAWREALSYEHANVNALQGLAELYLRTGREREAEQLAAAVPPAQRQKVTAALNAARASLFKQRANALLACGDKAGATRMLERALPYDRSDPWLRYDLARLYMDGGDAARGNALFTQLLADHPDDPAARYAQALYLARQDRQLDALTTLERIAADQRNAGMSSLQRRLWVDLVTGHARALAQAGRRDAAFQALRSASNALGKDPERALDLADAWIDIGGEAQARAMLAGLERAEPVDDDWNLRYARLLFAAHADDAARASADRLARRSLRETQRKELQDLQVAMALRAADAYGSRGEPAAALQALAPWRRRLPDNPRLLAAEARYLRTTGRADDALCDYRALLALRPADRDAASSIVELLIAQHLLAEARPMAEAQAADLHDATPDQFADVAANLLDLDNDALAGTVVEEGLATAPDNPRLLALAGQLARRDGRLEDAIGYLRRSLANEMARRAPATIPAISMLSMTAPPAGSASRLTVSPAPAGAAAAAEADGNGYLYRRMADMLDQHTTWLAAAADLRQRSGTPGISEYRAAEMPFEWKQPQTRDGRWIYRADLVSLDAGNLDLANANGAFGGCMNDNCGTGLRHQHARGVALDAALQRDGTRYDIGISPLGFPVHYLVGGILHKGDIGPFGYSVDVSRRPLTGSLLSYAGAVDPASGRVWGGVRATGIRFGLSLDNGGTFGGWSSLGLHLLSGDNVLTNRRLQLMGGAVVRVINEDNRLLQFGVTGMLWRLSDNDGEYTFGHGGYYSPASYRSLSLPVTFGLRGARWSMAARAAISVSHSETDDALYYPTDPAIQNAAIAGFTPLYRGGPGSGTGRSLSLSLEYQADPRLFVGGRFELERSPDYAPNRMVLYLRYALDRKSARPVAFLPEPVDPTSQY